MALPQNKRLRKGPKQPYNNEGRTHNDGGKKQYQNDGRPNLSGTRPPGGKPPKTDQDKHPPGWRPPKHGGLNGDGPRKNKGGGGKFFGGMGPYKGVPIKRVNQLINGIMRDELRDLRGEKRGIRRDMRNDLSGLRRDYQRGMGDLDHIYDETNDYMQHMNTQNQQMYDNAGNQVAGATQALQSQLGNTYTGAANSVNDEMARLGIQGAANTSQIQADSAFSQATAQQAGANAGSTLDLAQTNSGALSGLLMGMNQGQYQSSAGQQLNAFNDGRTDVMQNKLDNMQQIRDAMRDVKGSRRDLFIQMLNQLQQTGWGQMMDLQQLNLQKKQMRKGRR